MRLLNRVELIGEVVAKPELRHVEQQIPLCFFRIITARNWNDQEHREQWEYEWHQIVAWGRLAEVCHAYLHKNVRVYLEGMLKTRVYQDSQGHQHTIAEVIASDLIILDRFDWAEQDHLPDLFEDELRQSMPYEPPVTPDAWILYNLRQQQS